MRKADIPADIPHADLIRAHSGALLANGGSCVAGPDGEWVIEPLVGEERLLIASLDHQRVRAERQNFDPAGHYARPDVTQLIVHRQRQTTLTIVEQ
jgi:nitrilase